MRTELTMLSRAIEDADDDSMENLAAFMATIKIPHATKGQTCRKAKSIMYAALTLSVTVYMCWTI